MSTCATIDRSAELTGGVAGGSPVTRIACENSEVSLPNALNWGLPVVAVAVNHNPRVSAESIGIEKLALPVASVCAVPCPRNVWPSPKFDGSTNMFVKNCTV